MGRRFTAYPQYFNSFSSCNFNFYLPWGQEGRVSGREGHAYWCKKCAKCFFIFASMAAFLPRATVLDIFGADIFADQTLIPLCRRLLGLESFKPFDCVGTPEEMTVALYRAQQTGAYDADPVMDFFSEYMSSQQTDSFDAMQKRVLSLHDETAIDAQLEKVLGNARDA